MPNKAVLIESMDLKHLLNKVNGLHEEELAAYGEDGFIAFEVLSVQVLPPESGMSLWSAVVLLSAYEKHP